MTIVHQTLLAQHLDRIELIDRQIEQLNRLCAVHMQAHQAAIVRLVEVPGIGPETAQEIIAEIRPTASAFPSGPQLASWIGACPGATKAPVRTSPVICAKGDPFASGPVFTSLRDEGLFAQVRPVAKPHIVFMI